MHAIDLNARYSIQGTSVRMERTDGQTLVLHAPLRLCPGRTVSIRTGATTFQAMVLNAHVVALHGEQGTTYEIQAELTGDSAGARRKEPLSQTASPAVAIDASQKGGNYRAA
jgi:hypothetical protein